MRVSPGEPPGFRPGLRPGLRVADARMGTPIVVYLAIKKRHLYWTMNRGARTPGRFRDRVLLQFTSAENIRYLTGRLAAPADTAVARFAAERALEILEDDPSVYRGSAPDFWAEVKRLNRAFVDEEKSSAPAPDPWEYAEFMRESYHGLNDDGPIAGLARKSEREGWRPMRYESIPFWQCSGHRRQHEKDIAETLGNNFTEYGSHVRRYPEMEKRKKVYLPRTGPVI